MTRAQQIEQLQFDQEMDDWMGVDNSDDEDGDRTTYLTDELDYYPEDEHEQSQRNAEFQMADPLNGHSDE